MMHKLLITIYLIISSSLFAQSSAETPSGLIYTNQNPQLEFESLKTYDKPPDESGALAQFVFPTLTTTFIYAKIMFKNLLYKKRDQEYKLTYKWYLENGQRLGETSSTYLVEKDWDYAWYYDAWGWDQPTKWKAGTHRVEVWVNDVKFAVRTFTVASPSMEN